MELQFKFTWGGRVQRGGRYLFGTLGVFRLPEDKFVQVVFQGKRILQLALLVLAAAYFVIAGFIQVQLVKNPHNHIRYRDLVLPWHWSRIGALRGQANVDDGLDDIKAGKWSDGVFKLQIGLAKYPHSLPGREALAQFYLVRQERSVGMQTMQDGLSEGCADPEYVQSYCKMANDGEDYKTVVDVCDFVLKQPSANVPAELHHWVLSEKLQALIDAGRPAEAVTLAQAEGVNNSAVNELRVQALVAAGQAGEAAAFLKTWSERDGSTAQILRLQARVLRELGRLNEMESVLDRLCEASPTSPSAYVYGIAQRVLAGRVVSARHKMDDYFLQFCAQSKNLLTLTQAVGELKSVPLVRHCLDEARLQGFRQKYFLAILAETQILNGQWDGARDSLSQWEPTVNQADGMETTQFKLTTLVLAAASGDSADAGANLVGYCSNRELSVKTLSSIAGVLQRAGRRDSAWQIVNIGLHFYPESTTLGAIAKQTNDAPAAPQTTRTAKAQQSDQAAAISRSVAADQPAWFEAKFFADEERLLQAGRWDEAEKAIAQLRQASPDWLPAREADVRWLEVKALHGQGDLLAMMAVLGSYLDGGPERARQASEFARDLRRQEPDTAYKVIEAVLAKSPDYFLARQLKNQWQPKPEKPQ